MAGSGTKGKLGIAVLAGADAEAKWALGYSAPTIQVPFLTESLTPSIDQLEDLSLTGQASNPPPDPGGRLVAGETTHVLDYNNYGELIKGIMGAEAAGVYTMLAALDEVFYLEIDKDIERWRIGPAMISKLTIRGNQNALTEATIQWVAKWRTRVATAFPALSVNTQNRLRHSDLTFRIADLGDAIAAGDAMGISGYELEIERSMIDDDRDSESGQDIIVPIEDGFPMVRLNLNFSRYNSTTKQLVDWYEAATPLQADFLYSRSGETMKLELPNLRAEEGFGAPIEGPGPVRLEGRLGAYASLAGNPMYVGNQLRITIT